MSLKQQCKAGLYTYLMLFLNDILLRFSVEEIFQLQFSVPEFHRNSIRCISITLYIFWLFSHTFLVFACRHSKFRKKVFCVPQVTFLCPVKVYFVSYIIDQETCYQYQAAFCGISGTLSWYKIVFGTLCTLYIVGCLIPTTPNVPCHTVLLFFTFCAVYQIRSSFALHI